MLKNSDKEKILKAAREKSYITNKRTKIRIISHQKLCKQGNSSSIIIILKGKKEMWQFRDYTQQK